MENAFHCLIYAYECAPKNRAYSGCFTSNQRKILLAHQFELVCIRVRWNTEISRKIIMHKIGNILLHNYRFEMNVNKLIYQQSRWFSALSTSLGGDLFLVFHLNACQLWNYLDLFRKDSPINLLTSFERRWIFFWNITRLSMIEP